MVGRGYFFLRPGDGGAAIRQYWGIHVVRLATETSIITNYDFGAEMKDFYFSKIKNGKEKKNIVRQYNLDIYKPTIWEGKCEGKVFLPNSIIVAYYTREENLEPDCKNVLPLLSTNDRATPKRLCLTLHCRIYNGHEQKRSSKRLSSAYNPIKGMRQFSW